MVNFMTEVLSVLLIQEWSRQFNDSSAVTNFTDFEILQVISLSVYTIESLDATCNRLLGQFKG